MELREFSDRLLLAFQEMDLSEAIAKSYNYRPERNLLDQSMWDHIRTGVEACQALLSHLDSLGFHMDEEELKIALIAFVVHDLHKDPSVEKQGSGEYSIPLEEIERVCSILCEAVGTDVPPAAFLRVAGVSSFSPKLGDLGVLSGEYHWSSIRDWVKLMDQAASITCIAECMEKRTLHNLTEHLCRLLPPKLTGNMRIVYHYVQEMRGMVTTQMHNGMALLMKRHGYFPWLRFGDGTLYITFGGEELPEKSLLIDDLAELFFRSIANAADQVNREKLFDRTTLQCQPLAFLLHSSPQDFARLFHEIFLKASGGSKTFPEKNFDEGKLASYGVTNLNELYKRFEVDSSFDEEFREKWFYTARYFAALQRLIQRLEGSTPSEVLLHLANYLNLNADDIVELVPDSLHSNNKRFDGAIWLAYRYIKYAEVDGKNVAHLPIEDWRLAVRKMAEGFLEGKVTPEKVMEIIGDELKIHEDLMTYFREQLVVSWERNRELNRLDSKELLKKKTRSQKRICNLCNRQILAGVKPKVKGKVIQDSVNVFSNRILPKGWEPGKRSDVAALHWCSVCSFEFILRQVFSVDSFAGGDKSRQIYLFAFPSFQITEEGLLELQEELKHFFGSIYVHRRGKLKHTWQVPFVEDEKGHLRDHLRVHFQLYSEYFQQELAERERPPSTGDVLKASPPGNVLMFTYDCYSNTLERTREEAWMKALTAALSLHKLYGFRILLTEKPFLFLSDVREVHYAIHMDAPPYKVARLLEGAESRGTTDFVIPIEQVNVMLYRMAYIWEIHQTVHPIDFSKPTDKHVSSVLHLMDVHPMAGACFFKRFLMEQPYATDAFVRSCREINLGRGGKEMGLAREIALASLELYKPDISHKGRAHRYENLFRLAVKGIKEKRDKSELCGLITKRLDRLINQQGSGYVPRIDEEAVIRFVDLVYDRFFLEVCGGNIAKLNQKQNQLADGIFFETHLERLKQIREKQAEKAENIGREQA
ncbi:type I-D CRISPR-associated protein Cas10d/Csc3 [Staphylospora marina]|uniref:type I-D CRISPR-associated protein Cas10d/Csc3 n=1 Tax=Staphylospora marina TaxID=2490858 RepID=UPI000F5B94B2|nr:type I-D CRISPR-associated protein Cas10d/Csc3 [Staphylospora marina]